MITRLKILGFRNIFDVSKVSQPSESEFFMIKIEFPMYVVETPTSQSKEKEEVRVFGINLL